LKYERYLSLELFLSSTRNETCELLKQMVCTFHFNVLLNPKNFQCELCARNFKIYWCCRQSLGVSDYKARQICAKQLIAHINLL